jgi:hypothetical protein
MPDHLHRPVERTPPLGVPPERREHDRIPFRERLPQPSFEYQSAVGKWLARGEPVDGHGGQKIATQPWWKVIWLTGVPGVVAVHGRGRWRPRRKKSSGPCLSGPRPRARTIRPPIASMSSSTRSGARAADQGHWKRQAWPEGSGPPCRAGRRGRTAVLSASAYWARPAAISRRYPA